MPESEDEAPKPARNKKLTKVRVTPRAISDAPDRALIELYGCMHHGIAAVFLSSVAL